MALNRLPKVCCTSHTHMDEENYMIKTDKKSANSAIPT